MTSAHPVTKSFRWIGPPIKEDSNRIYYGRLRIQTNIPSDKPLDVQVGDKVYLHSAERVPFIAEVVRLYENRKSSVKKLKALWFYRANEIDIETTELVLHPQELFSSNHVDSNEVTMIWGKCSVLFVPIEMVLPETFHSKDLYFCRYFINRESKPWEIMVTHSSVLLNELKKYQLLSEEHRRKIQSCTSFWSMLSAIVQQRFAEYASDPSLSIFFQNIPRIELPIRTTTESTSIPIPNAQESLSAATTGPVIHTSNLPSSIPSVRLANRVFPHLVTNSSTTPVPNPTQPVHQEMRSTNGSDIRNNDVRIGNKPYAPESILSAISRNQSSREPSFKFKKLSINLSDFELALELLKQEKLHHDPLFDLSLIRPDSFTENEQRDLIFKFRKRIYYFRNKKRHSHANSGSVISSTQKGISSPNKPFTPSLSTPGFSHLLLTTLSENHQTTNSTIIEKEEKDEDLYFTNEDAHDNSQELWFKEDEEDNPRLPKSSFSPSFLNTKEGKARKKAKKRKRSVQLVPHIEPFASSSSAPLIRKHGDEGSESSVDPEEDYFEDEQAEIPVVKETIDPVEHRTISLQSEQQRLVYDFSFPIDYYELLAYEEILRVKLDFIINLSNEALYGGRDSRAVTTSSTFSSNSTLHSYAATGSSSTRPSLYGHSTPTVDGSLIMFRGDVQELILDALLQSDNLIIPALQLLQKRLQPRLLVWTVEEQQIIHYHFDSKDARNLSKLKRQLKKKTIKDILDYKSRFISGARAFEGGYNGTASPLIPPIALSGRNSSVDEIQNSDMMQGANIVNEVPESQMEKLGLNEVNPSERRSDETEVPSPEKLADESLLSRFETSKLMLGHNDEGKEPSEDDYNVENHSEERSSVMETKASEDDNYYFKDNIDEDDELVGSEEGSNDLEYLVEEHKEDTDYYWSPVETNVVSLNKPKKRKVKRMTRPKRSLRSNSSNADYAKAIIASYVQSTKERDIQQRFTEFFDAYSSHQFNSTIYVWRQKFLLPSELRIRVIHILQNAYYKPDSIYGERRIPTTLFLGTSDEKIALYLQKSQKVKHEFYEQFCLVYPMETREAMSKIPLFCSENSSIPSSPSLKSLCKEAGTTATVPHSLNNGSEKKENEIGTSEPTKLLEVSLPVKRIEAGSSSDRSNENNSNSSGENHDDSNNDRYQSSSDKSSGVARSEDLLSVN